MYYYQKWSKNSFECKYLNKIKSIINENPNIKVYIGFDFGFFRGINIYYGSNKSNHYALKIYNRFKDEKLNIRLFTNIDVDLDVIILLGYTNLKEERVYLKKNYSKIMKALSFF